MKRAQRQKEYRMRKKMLRELLQPKKIPKTNAERQREFRQRKKNLQQSETFILARKKKDAERSKRYRDRLKSETQHVELDSLLTSKEDLLTTVLNENQSETDHYHTTNLIFNQFQMQTNEIQPSMNNGAKQLINPNFQAFQAPYEEHHECAMPNVSLHHEANISGNGTSAMGNHLKKKHPEEFQAIVKDKVVETSPFHYVVIDPVLTSTIKQECDDPEEEEEEYSENKTHINDSSNDIEETSRDTTSDVLKKRKFVDSTPPQKKQISESYTMEVLKCMKTLTETMAKRDEYSIYGEYIANKLRNSCRTDVEIAIAQHEIDNICFKLTMGEYSQMTDNQASSSSGVFIKQSPTISEYSPTLSEHSPTM